MSKITHNISLSYMPKIASYFMDIIIHQKFFKNMFNLLCLQI